MRRYAGVLITLVLGLAMTLPTSALGQGRGGGGGPQASQPGPLRWEYMGPPSSGRFTAIAGIPGDRSTYFLGAASGGVWKTTDAGESFRPTFDDQPVQAIGSLAVASSDPQIVWAGTGEAWAIRDADVWGDGIYKSVDGGESWTHMGLTETGRIGRILIHPIDPNVVYACALGRITGPQEERGVFRTRDGGDSWTRLGEENGLPRSPVGKIDVAVAPSNSDRVYALIQTAAQGSVWRSDDGGRSWRAVSWNRTLIGREGFYIRIAVNPDDADEVVVMNSSSHRSVDGRLTWPLRAGGCGDCHDV